MLLCMCLIIPSQKLEHNSKTLRGKGCSFYDFMVEFVGSHVRLGAEFFFGFFYLVLVFPLCLSIFAAPVIKSPYTLLTSFL